MFDWNDLRYLLAVARTGSLVAAGKELGVQHTTVARRLKALEDEVGPLLNRSGAATTLTELGKELVVTAEEMEAKAVAFVQRKATTETRVRMTAPSTFASYFIRQIEVFRERHPKIVIEVLSENRLYDLEKGEADLAIRLHSEVVSSLVDRKLVPPAWSLYVSQAYLARNERPGLDDIERADFIGFDSGPLSKGVGAEWLAKENPNAKIAFRANTIEQVLDAALQGLGLAFLPCFIGDREPRLERVWNHALHNRYARLVYTPDAARRPAVRTVIDYIVEIFDRDADLFTGKLTRS